MKNVEKMLIQKKKSLLIILLVLNVSLLTIPKVLL